MCFKPYDFAKQCETNVEPLLAGPTKTSFIVLLKQTDIGYGQLPYMHMFVLKAI